MTRRRPIRNGITLLAALALPLTAAALAANQPEVASGIVLEAGPQVLVIETTSGRETYELAPGASLPSELASGDAVLVRLDETDGRRAGQVLIIDDRVEVTDELVPEGERAVLGTVSATGTDQLLVETTSGEQAFVVDPEKLFPPLPTPEEKVAVTYRTLEVHPPRHMATGLVVLPADFRLTAGNVRVSSEPVAVAQAPPPEPLPERLEEEPPALPTPARMIEPVAEPIEPLPQTATPLPLLLGAGALLLGLAVATRHDQ